MGETVSLQGRFSHDMNLNFSILVSFRKYTEIDQSIEFQWGNFAHSDRFLISVSLYSTWTPPYLFWLHF